MEDCYLLASHFTMNSGFLKVLRRCQCQDRQKNWRQKLKDFLFKEPVLAPKTLLCITASKIKLIKSFDLYLEQLPVEIQFLLRHHWYHIFFEICVEWHEKFHPMWKNGTSGTSYSKLLEFLVVIFVLFSNDYTWYLVLVW